MGQQVTRALDIIRPGNLLIAGGFIPNGSSALATFYGNQGWSAVRTAVGVYTVTVSQNMYEFVYFAPPTVQVARADGNTYSPYIGAVTSKREGDAANTFEICIKAAADEAAAEAVLTDLSTSTTVNRIHFACVVATGKTAGTY